MSDERCRHDMLPGTCDICSTAPRGVKHRHDLVLRWNPDDENDHRVHEPWCYWADNEPQGKVPWPRRSLTHQDAAGMIPCGHCQPMVAKS